MSGLRSKLTIKDIIRHSGRIGEEVFFINYFAFIE